jgi:hypothetical protein
MQRHPYNQITRLHWYLRLFVIVIISLTITTGCMHSKPLSLRPDETIRGIFRIDTTRTFHIGDPIPLLLMIEAKKGVTYQLPEFNEPTLGELEYNKKISSIIETFPGGSRQTARYLFTGWQVSPYTIPGVVISFETPTHHQGTLKLAPISIRLRSVLPKGISNEELLTLNIKGIKSPLGLTPRYSLLKWFLLGVLIIGLIFLFMRIYRRFILKSTTDQENLIIEPAHVNALRRLEKLKTLSLAEHEDYKIFYSELSECIREYMENRYLIRALEMTTEEFLIQLTTEAYLNQEQQVLLKGFMEQSDLVKFAKQSPSREEATESLDHIEQLVEATKETEITESNPLTPIATTLQEPLT